MAPNQFISSKDGVSDRLAMKFMAYLCLYEYPSSIHPCVFSADSCFQVLALLSQVLVLGFALEHATAGQGVIHARPLVSFFVERDKAKCSVLISEIT